MKKKNIVKKLLSVILSAATMFSLLTLPAHAIIPGEDSYIGQENGYIHIDFEHQTTEFIHKSSVPKFTGTSTYDVLNREDRLRMENINQRMLNHYSTLDVDDGTHSFVNPANGGVYSGVVVIAVFIDNVYQTYGTGFMLNEDTFLTALHVIYDTEKINEKDEFIITDSLPEVRIYFDIYDTLSFDFSNEHPISNSCRSYFQNNSNYYIASEGVFSSAVENLGTDSQYDWFIGKLESNAPDDTYFFDCIIADRTLHNKRSFIVGYPQEYALRMVESIGIIEIVHEPGSHIETSNSTDGGMSGGPAYYISNGVKCFGIHRADGSWETRFYDDFMDVIVCYMNE